MDKREARRKALHDAARSLGLDGHVKELRYKKDACTRAEQIAMASAGIPLDCKNGYLYCDGLDACFYFTAAGAPQCAMACVVGLGSRDFDGIERAVELMRAMLRAMDDHRARIEREETGDDVY